MASTYLRSLLAAAVVAAPLAAAASPTRLVAVTGCMALHPQLSFCQQGADWLLYPVPRPESLAIWQRGVTTGRLIAETTGARKDITLKEMQGAVLASVTRDARKIGDIEIVDVQGEQVSGRIVGTVRYTITTSTGPVATLHSFMVAEGLVLQMLTSRPADGAEGAETVHRNFLSHLRLEKPRVDA